MKILKPISPDVIGKFQDTYGKSSPAKRLRLKVFHPRKFNAMVESIVAGKQLHGDASELAKSNKELSAEKLALKKEVSRLEKLMPILFHDIKSPVATIEGFCTVIKEDHGESMNPEARNYLSIIIGAARQINNIIADLSEWASASEMAIEPFLLSDIVAKAVELNRIVAEKKGIKLSSENTNGMVFADKKMTFFVLRNLIANSVKFTEEGGFIRVSASDKGDFMEISVTDNGMGIAPWRLDRAHMGNIFEGGMHASTAGTKGETGTGFGIRTCEEFVEQMGGEIRVESNTAGEARGTTFFFTLPRKDPDEKAAASG